MYIYDHKTRLSWPEILVKIYIWVEIVACHTQQRKQKLNKNILVIRFIYKCKPDPTRSQEKCLRSENNDMANLLIEKQVTGMQLNHDRFHFRHKFNSEF